MFSLAKCVLLVFVPWVAMIAMAVHADTSLRLATTTSTYHSGLLDFLLPVYQHTSGVHIQVISVGTGAALRLGQEGDVDLVITHAPEAEAVFINAGHGVMPRPFMFNDFVIVGPQADPASLKMAQSLEEALMSIAQSNVVFVSRGDNSGTHTKELQLWRLVSQELPFAGYRSIGQGMGRVLAVADEMEGYALTDRGTWLAMKQRLDLALLYAGDKQLFNPYQVMLVNPERHPHVKYDQAKAFADWLVSEQAQQLIDAFSVDSETLFFGFAHQPVTTP